MEKLERKDIPYLYLLRILATFGVILLHSTAYHFGSVDLGSGQWMVLNGYRSATTVAVPLFVMISGALLLCGDSSYSKLRRRILHILCAFFFWSFLYTAWLYHFGAGLQQCAAYFFTGCYHMWFCPMIIGLYLITPLLKRIVEREDLIKRFLLLSFLFAFFIPRVNSLVFARYMPSVGQTIYQVTTNMNLQLPLGYTGYYVLGYYLHSREISRKQELVILPLAAMSLIFIILMTRMESLRSGVTSDLYYQYMSCPVLMLSIGLFVLIKNHTPPAIVSREKIMRTVRSLSDACFGIYLMHVFILELSLPRLPQSFIPVLAVPFQTVLTFFLALLVSLLLRRIPVFGRKIT